MRHPPPPHIPPGTSAPIHSTTTPDTLSLAAFRFEVNAFDTLAAVAAPLATRTGALGSLVVPLVHACGEGLCRIMRYVCGGACG